MVRLFNQTVYRKCQGKMVSLQMKMCCFFKLVYIVTLVYIVVWTSPVSVGSFLQNLGSPKTSWKGETQKFIGRSESKNLRTTDNVSRGSLIHLVIKVRDPDTNSTKLHRGTQFPHLFFGGHKKVKEHLVGQGS